MAFFDVLMDDLAKEIGLPKLTPDNTGQCLIRIENRWRIFIQPGKIHDTLLIGCSAGKLDTGPFRMRMLEIALQANAQPPPLYGKLAYSTDTDHLIVFDHLPTDGLTATKMVEYFRHFFGKVRAWSGVIDIGIVPEGSPSESTEGSGMFGL